MMTMTLALESFDEEDVTVPSAHPEYLRGREDGIQSEQLRTREDQKQLTSLLVGAIADAQFSFSEARQSVLGELAPLLEVIATHILPATQTLGLTSTICEILAESADACLSTQPTITVHPDHISAMTEALDAASLSKITVLSDPTLTTHAAWLSVRGRDSIVDFENTFAAVQTAIRAFTTPHERDTRHG